MKNCTCDITPDGECETCRATASTAGQRFKEFLIDMMRQLNVLEKEFMGKIESLKASGDSFEAVGSCGRCVDKYIDLAASKMVDALADGENGDGGGQFGIALIKSIQATCAKRGIKHLPLTERAWANIRGSSR